MIRHLFFYFFLFTASFAEANDRIYRQTVNASLDSVVTKLYSALEDQRLFVVFEADIGQNLARFEEKWGDDFNRNGLEGIRSMVFCNAWYANQVSNKDPDMLALCPLHLTLMHKQGVTTILFVRPSTIAQGSAAEPVLREVEQKVISVIQAVTQTSLSQ